MTTRRNRLRAVTSLFFGPAFIIVALSGLILYVGPRGRVADWNEWTLLGLSKDAWQELHIVISLALIPVALLHWILNWTSFWAYIKKKTGGLNHWRETLVAGSLLVLITGGTVLLIPPFSSMLDLSSYCKDGWDQRYPGPPVASAEKLTLEEFGEVLELDVDAMVVAMEKEGLEVTDRTVTVIDFAHGQGITPPEVLDAIQKHHPKAGAGG